MKKNKLATIFIVILLALALTPVNAATSGDSSGEADVDNASPVISNVDLEDTESASQDGSQIDVNTEYRVDFDIADDNTLEDLDTVTITIWGPSSSEGGADSESDHYTFTYTQDTDTWAETGPDGGDSHLVSGSCVDPADQTAGSGSFTLAFKLAKIAERTDTATWTIKIAVTDDSAASDSDSTLSFGLNFYLELTVDDGSHSWSGLSPGDTDTQIDDPVDNDIDLTVTANAAFDLQAKSDGDLSSNGDTIPDENVKIHKDTVGSAVGLTTSYADIGGLTAQEAGSSLSKYFSLWITVPNPQQDGTYTYTLLIQGVEA